MNPTLIAISIHSVADALGLCPTEKQTQEILNEFKPNSTETEEAQIERLLLMVKAPKAKFYYREIKERNGDYEYYHKQTMKLPEAVDASDFLTDYISDFYDTKSEEDEGGFYFFGDEVYVSIHCIYEITKDEFLVLKKYIL